MEKARFQNMGAHFVMPNLRFKKENSSTLTIIMLIKRLKSHGRLLRLFKTSAFFKTNGE